MTKITLLPPEVLADPEVVAMLQAFYSRSSTSIEERLAELGENLPSIKESLKRWYIGYNHDSIGDCGNVAVFFEGVSILFAKALQDNPLYNGTETSTRFFDYIGSYMIYPTVSNSGYSDLYEDVQDSWLYFYEKYLPIVIVKLAKALPFSLFTGISETIWEASIRARAFDIMRAFLPAGTKTQLSFYGSLRNLRDNLSTLLHHPLEEVRDNATTSLQTLAERYPTAFDNEKFNEDQKRYLRDTATQLFYNEPSVSHEVRSGVLDTSLLVGQPLSVYLDWVNVKRDVRPKIIVKDSHITPYLVDLLNGRPKGLKVPFQYGRSASFTIRFMLDYGSGRDILRHRNCKIPIPVLSDSFGMHPWYVSQLLSLDVSIYKEARKLIESNYARIRCNLADFTPEELIQTQYIHPLGMLVPFELHLDLDQMFYLAELRSSKTVHPTLRPIAIEIGHYLKNLGFNVYVDSSEDAFVPYRGKQTISKAEQNDDTSQ